MNWLNSALHEIANLPKWVYFTGHIPPHPDLYKPECFRKYVELSAKYNQTIKAHLFGHTHADQFWLLNHPEVENNRPAAVINVSPGIIPSYNPSLRMFNYDPSNGDLKEIWQYYSDISQDNRQNELPDLQLEYRLTNAYEMSDLSLDSWIDLSHRIATNATVRALYQKYKTVSSGASSFKDPFVPTLRDLHCERQIFA